MFVVTIGPVKSMRRFRADVNLFMYSSCLLPVQGKSGVGLLHIMLLIIASFVKIGAKRAVNDIYECTPWIRVPFWE